MVERLVWDQDAAGSNPVIPTMFYSCGVIPQLFFIEFYSMSFCGLTDVIKFLEESFSTEFIGILRFCLLRLSGFDIVIGCRKAVK